jgi:hypothetical protein
LGEGTTLNFFVVLFHTLGAGRVSLMIEPPPSLGSWITRLWQASLGAWRPFLPFLKIASWTFLDLTPLGVFFNEVHQKFGTLCSTMPALGAAPTPILFA